MVLISDTIILIIIISIIKSVLIAMSFSLYGSNITETGTMKKAENNSYCRICKECVSSCKGTIIIIVWILCELRTYLHFITMIITMIGLSKKKFICIKNTAQDKNYPYSVFGFNLFLLKILPPWKNFIQVTHVLRWTVLSKNNKWYTINIDCNYML